MILGIALSDSEMYSLTRVPITGVPAMILVIAWFGKTSPVIALLHIGRRLKSQPSYFLVVRFTLRWTCREFHCLLSFILCR